MEEKLNVNDQFVRRFLKAVEREIRQKKAELKQDIVALEEKLNALEDIPKQILKEISDGDLETPTSFTLLKQLYENDDHEMTKDAWKEALVKLGLKTVSGNSLSRWGWVSTNEINGKKTITLEGVQKLKDLGMIK